LRALVIFAKNNQVNVKKLLLIIFVSVFISCSQKKEESIQNKFIIKDDLGNEFAFENQPERIISLAPNITEMVFDLGLGKRIVGNTTYCNFPPESNKIQKVGDLLSVNYEKVLSLKPDIIFITTEGNTKIAYDKLISLKQKVFVLNPQSFNDIKNDYLKIASVFGKMEIAKDKISIWESVEDSVREIFKTQPISNVMFLVSLHPVILAGEKTFINEFLSITNLKNIAVGTKVNYPVFSREEILLQNPKIILHTTHNEKSSEILTAYPEWQKLDAIKKNKVYYLNPDLYFRPGPRYIEGLRDLSQKLR